HADLSWLQPAAAAASDRHRAHRRSRAGRLQGHRPRPRGGRERPPDRRLQPGRLTPAHAGRAAAALPARRAALHGERRPAGSAPLVPDLVHAQANYKYTGAASCGSSSCHGSTKPKADFPKLNENIVWQQKDKHAKAYATLTNEKLKSGVSPSKIAQNLKIAKAETSSKCLVCHAVDVKPELRGPKFDISEGVHCDGCHGPAEKWLEPHAEKGWTHEK